MYCQGESRPTWEGINERVAVLKLTALSLTTTICRRRTSSPDQYRNCQLQHAGSTADSITLFHEEHEEYQFGRIAGMLGCSVCDTLSSRP
jgi:hypothetical protein